jgi:hypothetical protein
MCQQCPDSDENSHLGAPRTAPAMHQPAPAELAENTTQKYLDKLEVLLHVRVHGKLAELRI